MSPAGRRWRGGLLVVLMVGHVGCAARGRADGLLDPGGRSPAEAVSVAAGDGRVRVTRDDFAEAWVAEAGRCTREMVGPVVRSTFGTGLIVLPAVCGAMTGVLPGMTTRFAGGRMRRGIEQSLASRDLHATLRDGIAAAAQASGRPVRALPGPTGEPQPIEDAVRPEAILEVTVSELRIRDDGTLSSVAARARLLRPDDRAELLSRAFRQEAPRRQSWWLALEPALSDLSVVIVEAMVPTSGPAAAAGFRTGEKP